MNLPGVQRETQEDDNSLWSLYPVQDIDMVLTNRYGDGNDTISLLYCGPCLKQFKESLKQTMLDQESIFEDQIHELHRLYRRQKDLMMEIGETNNNLCSQRRHLLLNAGESSPRASVNWMNSSISTLKSSVLPQIDACSKIDEAGDEGEKSEEKELPSYSYLDIGEEEEGSKNVQYLLDLNEPAKIEEHSDCEPDQFRTSSERAELEAQEPPISTISLVENGINLNLSPLEEVTTFKKMQPREVLAVSLHGEHISGPVGEIVQALPCSKAISLFHKRSSSWPRKKVKRKAKYTTTEAIVDMSLSNYITPLHWFANIASSVVEESKSELGLSVTGFHSGYYTDYFEVMTLQLTEMKPNEERTKTSASTIVHPKHKRTRDRQGKRPQHENLPNLSTFTGKDASQDLKKVKRLNGPSETNDAHCSLMENTVIDWGSKRKRRRGIRVPATDRP